MRGDEETVLVVEPFEVLVRDRAGCDDVDRHLRSSATAVFRMAWSNR